MGNTKKLRHIVYIAAAVLFVGAVMFILRGPHISNALKKIILPELEHMLGRKVIAQKIYFNLFPLFIEAKGLKVFDEEGNRVLTAKRVKGYIGLSGIFRKELTLKRIVLKEPEMLADSAQLNEISSNIRDYLAKKDPKKIRISPDVIEVSNGEFSFYDAAHDSIVTAGGFDGEIVLGRVPKLKAHIKELISNIRGFPELRCELNSVLFFRKDGIDVKDITLKSYGSKMQATGFYSLGGEGTLKADLDLLADSVKQIFGLSRRGEGNISAKGDIKIHAPEGKGWDWKNVIVDIKLRGGFYIQTLMELLKVKEKVEGWVDVDGKISGSIHDLAGSADARLRNGNLFNINVDALRCKVFYSNGVISFKDGKGLLYNGHADAEASIRIPRAEHYSVKVNFTDVDSPGVLKLIGWEPDIPLGKVRGEMHSSGSKFNPEGWFDYNSREAGANVLGRIKKIKGNYMMQDDIVTLSDTEVRTESSILKINGTVDTYRSMLNLEGRLETSDIVDITAPYFNRLKGAGHFTGTVTGKFGDPVIDGTLKATSASFDDYGLEVISGNVSYRKNFLMVKELYGRSKDEEHYMNGSIRFDNAKELFDLKHPDYKLAASFKRVDFGKLVKIFYRELPLKGRANLEFSITGKGPAPEYSGIVDIDRVEAYGFPLDSVSAGFSYNYKDFVIRKAILKRGGSALFGEAKISAEEKFSFDAHAEKIYLRDIELKGAPDNAALSFKAEGTGTFDNPAIDLNATLSGGVFKGKPVGDGKITASIKNKNILFNALLFNGKTKVTGRAYLSGALPWNAEIDVASGRYDFILALLLKDVPEDLLLHMKGNARLSGDRRHVSAAAVINQVNIALLGNSFSNDSDIKIRLDNRNMLFSPFTMRSGNASFSMQGNVEIGKEYNIALKGSSALSPLKSFSEKISVLRGDADFTLSVTGKWDDPKINGNLSVANASLGLKDVPQRISSISGLFFFKDDRIVVERLSGDIGGGGIDITGILYLKGFGIKRFYLDTRLKNISTAISSDFTVNFSGNAVYKGTPDSQYITGDIKISRARYRERVEWKSWILTARPKEKPKAELSRIEKTVLNVKIFGTKDIIVDNNIARTPLKVDIVLRGTIGHPLLFGRVETREGKVYFRNNEFQILNASADFADPNRINPTLEIVAQTVVKGYNIKLSLEGQLERFNLSLGSDPPLEETDILSLLTVGQIGKELKGLEAGIGAGEAAAFLTGKVQDVIEDRIRNITGLDRVQVDPYVSRSTGTVGPRVTVSKRLLAEKLFVTYISSIGSTEEQVIRLEYILGKNVSLVGVRDEKGSVGGDIKFRFEFK